MEVLKFPDPRLKQLSTRVEDFDSFTYKMAKQLLEIMYAEGGVGLAAPQVGYPTRLIVLDTDWITVRYRVPTVIINPLIFEYSEQKVKTLEACLSIPGFKSEVERSSHIKVQYHDLDGEFRVESATGLRAVCFQHEIDHLDGILFIGRISRLKRDIFVRKHKKRRKAGGH